MKNFTVGLVVEGANDNRVLREIIPAVILSRISDATVSFIDLQPKADATSVGKLEAGGLHSVYKWCLRFPPRIRRKSFFEPQLQSSRRIDLLIVQLDCDVIDEVWRCSKNVPLPRKPWTGKKRGRFVENVLEGWLWNNAEGDEKEHQEKHIVVAVVWALESWFIAALDKRIKNPEDRDPVPELIRLVPAIEDPRRRGKLIKQSTERVYKGLRRKLITEIAHSRIVCGQLDKFCVNIENFADSNEN